MSRSSKFKGSKLVAALVLAMMLGPGSVGASSDRFDADKSGFSQDGGPTTYNDFLKAFSAALQGMDKLLATNFSGNLARIFGVAPRDGLGHQEPGDIVGKDYGSPGQAAFDAAKAAIGGRQRTLYLTPGTWVFNSDDHCPANITLKLARGAILSDNGGSACLTISGPFEAGIYKVFDFTGTGKVRFRKGGPVEQVYPEWWGASPTARTAVNDAAFAAALQSDCPKIALCQSGYPLAAAWTFHRVNYKNISGKSIGTRLDWAGAAGGTQISISDCSNITFDNIFLNGTNFAARGFDLQSSTERVSTNSIYFNRCSSYNHSHSGWSGGNWTETGEDRDIHNITLTDCQAMNNTYNLFLDSLNCNQIVVRGGVWSRQRGGVHETVNQFHINRGYLYLYAPVVNTVTDHNYVLYCKTGNFQWFGMYADAGYSNVQTGLIYLDTPDVTYVYRGVRHPIRTAVPSLLEGVSVRGTLGGDPWVYLNTRSYGLTVINCAFLRNAPAEVFALKGGAKLTSIGNKYCAWSGIVKALDGDDSGFTSISDQITTDYITWAPAPLKAGSGEVVLGVGNHQQYTQIYYHSTEITSFPAGSTCTWTGAIPAGCLVMGVTSRVTEAIAGPTGINIGTAASPDLFSHNSGVALGTTTTLANGTATAPSIYPKATNMVITAQGRNFTGGAGKGKIRITVHYMKLHPPAN